VSRTRSCASPSSSSSLIKSSQDTWNRASRPHRLPYAAIVGSLVLRFPNASAHLPEIPVSGSKCRVSPLSRALRRRRPVQPVVTVAGPWATNHVMR
jgi:hypothetical protein